MLRCLALFAVLLFALWAIAALVYLPFPTAWLNIVGPLAFMALLVVLWRRVSGWRRVGALLVLNLAVVGIFFSLRPSNTRHWQAPGERLARADINGNRVIIHNVRNFDYRSVTNFTERWETRGYDLDHLTGVDFYLNHWGSPYIAHTMMSFIFDNAPPLCISIEARYEVGEEYSAIKGFFRHYEIFYVLADERDVVRVRSNYRKESVRLYQLRAPLNLVRLVLLDYLKSVNQLDTRPEFYNALTENCTTSIRRHTHPFFHGKWNWRLLINGSIDQLLYDNNGISHALPLAELRTLSDIGERAMKADRDPDFSAKIREGLPPR
jgi:hypothetical protein